MWPTSSACSAALRQRWWQAIPVAVLSLAVWVLAALWRLRALDEVSLSSDSLGPFLAAWAAGPGSPLPLPPNPEGGFSLWIWSWPPLLLATDLTTLFALRFWQGALVAPLALLAAHRLTGSRTAGVAAGLLVALDSGLVDTLVSSFRGYGAPEWIALATLGAVGALQGRAWGPSLAVVGLVTAAGQHPFAAGAALAATCSLFFFRPGQTAGARWTPLLVAGMLGGTLSLPRLWWMAQLATCEEGAGGWGGGWACLQGVALGSAEPEARWGTLLLRAFGDRSAEVCFATLPLLVGLLAVRREERGARAWALAGLLGVLLLALVVHSLRPYHLRIAAVPLAVAAASGWWRLGAWWGGGLALAAIGLTALHPPPQGDPGALRRHDAAGAVLRQRAPAWVEGAWDGGPMVLDPAGVALSAALQGADLEAMRPALDRPVLLAVSMAGHGALRPFASAQDAAQWCAATAGIEGAGAAHDWSAALYPGQDHTAALWLSEAWRQQQRTEPSDDGGAP